MTASACLLCGDANAEFLYQAARTVLRCQVCQLVFAAPVSEASLRALYGRTYFHGDVYADYLAERDGIRRNAARAIEDLGRLTRGRHLLDVGCAAGFFLEAARDRGWSVEGIELSHYASAYARDTLHLPVRTGPVAELPDNAGPFDAVTLWDCIEHLQRPDLALSKLYRHLVPGGVLAVSTGDYDSLLRRVMGRRWRLFSDPTHNFFFTAATLRRILETSGFSVVGISRRGKWVSPAMLLKQAPLFPTSWRVRLTRALRGRYLYVNPRDVMTVMARAVERPVGSATTGPAGSGLPMPV